MSDIFDHEFDAFEPILNDQDFKEISSKVHTIIFRSEFTGSVQKPKDHETISRKDFKEIIGREHTLTSHSELLNQYKIPWPEGFSAWEYCQYIAYKIKTGDIKKK